MSRMKFISVLLSSRWKIIKSADLVKQKCAVMTRVTTCWFGIQFCQNLCLVYGSGRNVPFTTDSTQNSCCSSVERFPGATAWSRYGREGSVFLFNLIFPSLILLAMKTSGNINLKITSLSTVRCLKKHLSSNCRKMRSKLSFLRVVITWILIRNIKGTTVGEMEANKNRQFRTYCQVKINFKCLASPCWGPSLSATGLLHPVLGTVSRGTSYYLVWSVTENSMKLCWIVLLARRMKFVHYRQANVWCIVQLVIQRLALLTERERERESTVAVAPISNSIAFSLN